MYNKKDIKIKLNGFVKIKSGFINTSAPVSYEKVMAIDLSKIKGLK